MTFIKLYVTFSIMYVTFILLVMFIKMLVRFILDQNSQFRYVLRQYQIRSARFNINGAYYSVLKGNILTKLTTHYQHICICFYAKFDNNPRSATYKTHPIWTSSPAPLSMCMNVIKISRSSVILVCVGHCRNCRH